jgi:PAS domain S-box-containing protein
MAFNLKNLFTRSPEAISADHVSLRELPFEELGLTLFFGLFAGVWLVFSDDVVDWIMGVRIDSAQVQALRAINFVTTTSLCLYLVLRRTSRRRRQAMEALRLSQKRFELVALATTEAIWDLNLETKVVWWSQGMEKLFGYRREDVSSQFDWWLQRVHPEQREQLTEAIRRAVESGGQNWASEYRFRRKDDTYATVLDRGFIIRDAAGKPVRLVGGLADVSEQRLAEKALSAYREQLKALTVRLQSSREEERASVAREIHDDLGQLLTAIKLNLDWLEQQIGKNTNETGNNRLVERIVESSEMAETAIESVQRIAADLRPALLYTLGLSEALEEEARRFQGRSGIRCDLSVPAEPLTLAPPASIAIFRVFQEALTNVVRHAKASAVSTHLGDENAQIVLRISDNGQGIRPDAIGDPRSLGLLGMVERAAALGGSVSIEPESPHGTRVTLRLPYDVSVGHASGAL